METNEQLPRLKVRGPRGESAVVELSGDRLTVGRLAGINDLALEPDTESLITRQGHCQLDREHSTWWLSDAASVNGTLLVRGAAVQPVRTRIPLAHGDVIRILGARGPAGPAYWELLFEDPRRTRPVLAEPGEICVEFDAVQGELFVVKDGARQRITLRRQERKLVAYMAQRNAESGHVPALCPQDDLIRAVWGEANTPRRRNDLIRLIAGIRGKIAESTGPDLAVIENARGSGYRLNSSPESAAR
jgi:DNA-binding winged helix-turn-helix (wHTH) protein